ncbi:HlyD family efflux transporter periplasmic adaptor subunit [Paenibacillus sp. CC-CFT747]|nr:HlyD family efflux transporter periplasmic adaptor subunit [Paenibacillus sp. CC-CFT747]
MDDAWTRDRSYRGNHGVLLSESQGKQVGGKPGRGLHRQEGDIRTSVTGTSQLEPKDSQIITAPADGIIKTINLSRNQEVKAGDVLVELTNPTLENNLQKAKVSLASAQKDLNDLKEQIGSLTMTAPISGKLTLANGIDTGSSVNKNSKIATVSDIQNLTVTIPFLFEDASQLAPGDTVDLDIDGFMLTKTGTIKGVGRDARGDLKGGKLLDVEVAIENDSTMDAGLKAKGSVLKNGHTYQSQDAGIIQYGKVATILAGAAGTVETLHVKTNALVKEGAVIGTLMNDSLKSDLSNKQNNVDQQALAVQDSQDKLDALVVKAPFDGIFSTDFVNKKTNILTTLTPGTKVNSGTQFGGVASQQNMQLPIQVDELDLPNVKAGMKAEVKVDSLQNRIFNAEVSQVSTVGTTTNGVTFFDVVLSIQNTGQLKYGMTATGKSFSRIKKAFFFCRSRRFRGRRGNRSSP